jgi:hypothetical protein
MPRAAQAWLSSHLSLLMLPKPLPVPPPPVPPRKLGTEEESLPPLLCGEEGTRDDAGTDGTEVNVGTKDEPSVKALGAIVGASLNCALAMEQRRNNVEREEKDFMLG